MKKLAVLSAVAAFAAGTAFASVTTNLTSKTLTFDVADGDVETYDEPISGSFLCLYSAFAYNRYSVIFQKLGANTVAGYKRSRKRSVIDHSASAGGAVLL